MKNKLEIIEYNDGLVADTKYKVKDTYTVYLTTYNRSVAEHTYNLLKNEYNQGKQNAS